MHRVSSSWAGLYCRLLVLFIFILPIGSQVGKHLERVSVLGLLGSDRACLPACITKACSSSCCCNDSSLSASPNVNAPLAFIPTACSSCLRIAAGYAIVVVLARLNVAAVGIQEDAGAVVFKAVRVQPTERHHQRGGCQPGACRLSARQGYQTSATVAEAHLPHPLKSRTEPWIRSISPT